MPTKSGQKTSKVCDVEFVQTQSEITINTIDHGGSGPTVLFAHAASFHGRLWDQIVDGLAQTFRCIAFDLRGHGRSTGSIEDPSPNVPSWYQIFSDIPLVVDKLGLQTPILGVGHSLGAAGLLHTAAEHRNMFDRLWIYEPPVFSSPSHMQTKGQKMSEVAEKRRHVFASKQEAVEHLAQRPPFDTVDTAVLRDYVEYGFLDRMSSAATGVGKSETTLRCEPETEAAVYRQGGSFELFSRVSKVSIPVMVGSGGEDPAASALTQQLATELGDGYGQEFPGLGHLGPFQDPKRVSASIKAFFEDAF